MPILFEDDLALLNEAHLAHVATVMPDGSPHVTAVWVDTDGEHILINTAKGRQKYRNLERNPAIGVSIADCSDPYRTLSVRGLAQIVQEGADAHIDRLAKKYTGAERYQNRRPGEERVTIRITPIARIGARA